MSIAIKIWEISGDHIHSVEQESFAADHLEKHLEKWIVESPEILGEDLLIIAQQKRILGVGILDLLAVTGTGELVIVELKRGLTPRDAVAQALDYASWLDKLSESEIVELAESTLKRPFHEVFQERFGTSEVPSIEPENHRVLVVGPELDASAERIIHYLAERHSLRINAVFFRYARLTNGGKILARSVLVADSVMPTAQSGKKMTETALISMAAAHNTLPMLEGFRALANVDQEVWETPSRTFGGSFRFWRRDTRNKDRMLFGVNVSGKRCSPPEGQLDIWFPIVNLQKVFGVSEKQARKMLKKLGVYKMFGKDGVVRVKNQKEACAAVKQLQYWFNQHPSPEQD